MSGRLRPGNRTPLVKIAALDGTLDLKSGEVPTHLQFRRFAGCPVCTVHLSSFIRRADELRPNVREVLVFHSPIVELQRHVADLPFHVVADPAKSIYSAFGAEQGQRALLDPRAWPGIVRSAAMILPGVLRGSRTMPPTNPSGGRFGLPADFMISADGTLTACHYGRHVDDSWSVDDVLQFAAEAGAIRRTDCGADVGVSPLG